MKKLFKIISILLLITVLLTSCSFFTNSPTQKPSTPSVQKRDIIYNSDGEIDYSAMWPDKTLLIWAYSDIFEIQHYLNSAKYAGMNLEPYKYNVSDELIVLYNDYLTSNGSEYVISFINEMLIKDRILEDYNAVKNDRFAESLFIAKDLYSYFYDLIREMKSQGKQIDIISTGEKIGYSTTLFEKDTTQQASGMALEDPGGDAIKDGLFLDITDYLSNKNDTRLYYAVPYEYWRLFSCYDGIYGVYNNGLAESITLNIEQKVSDEYGIDNSDSDIIQEMDVFYNNLYAEYSNQVSNDELLLIQKSGHMALYHKLIGIYTDYDNTYLSFKYDDNKNMVAVNRFTDPDYIFLNETLAKWVANGYYGVNSEDYLPTENGIIWARDKSDIHEQKPYLSIIHTNDVSSSWFDKKYVPVEISEYILKHKRAGLTGIASWTKHADYAYDFLSLYFTDPYLSALMRSGDTEHGDIPSGLSIGQRSQLICRQLIEPTTPVSSLQGQVVKNIYIIFVPPGFAFNPVLDETEYDLLKIKELCDQADALWITETDKMSERLQETAMQLDKLGYTSLIAEINRQLNEFSKQYDLVFD